MSQSDRRPGLGPAPRSRPVQRPVGRRRPRLRVVAAPPHTRSRAGLVVGVRGAARRRAGGAAPAQREPGAGRLRAAQGSRPRREQLQRAAAGAAGAARSTSQAPQNLAARRAPSGWSRHPTRPSCGPATGKVLGVPTPGVAKPSPTVKKVVPSTVAAATTAPAKPAKPGTASTADAGRGCGDDGDEAGEAADEHTGDDEADGDERDGRRLTSDGADRAVVRAARRDGRATGGERAGEVIVADGTRVAAAARARRCATSTRGTTSTPRGRRTPRRQGDAGREPRRTPADRTPPARAEAPARPPARGRPTAGRRGPHAPSGPAPAPPARHQPHHRCRAPPPPAPAPRRATATRTHRHSHHRDPGRTAPARARGVTPPRPPRRRPVRRPAGNPDRRLRSALVVVLLPCRCWAAGSSSSRGSTRPAVAAQALEDQRDHDGPCPRTAATSPTSRAAVLASTVERRNIIVDQTLVKNYPGAGTATKPEGVAGAARALCAGARHGRRDAHREAHRHPAGRLRHERRDARGLPQDPARCAIPGIGAEQASRRVYPAQRVGAQVVGFLSRDGRALRRVERLYDTELKGTDGTLEVRARDGRHADPDRLQRGDRARRRSLGPADDRPGHPVEGPAGSRGAGPGPRRGDRVRRRHGPPAGRSSRWPSAPGFDAQNPGDSDAPDRENRALSDVFEPGSTSKVVTLAAALEEKVVTPATKVTVPAVLPRADRTFHDSARARRPRSSRSPACSRSRATSARSRLGEQVPPQKMYDYMRKFGLGTKTGIGLGESTGNPRAAGTVERLPALHRAVRARAVGHRAAVRRASSRRSRTTGSPGRPAGRRRHDGAGRHVHPGRPGTDGPRREPGDGPPDAAHDGERRRRGGHRRQGRDPRLPGRRQDRDVAARRPVVRLLPVRRYTASFIGMAPADNPSLVVAVDHPEAEERPTSAAPSAAPVFQQVMTYALTQRQVPPTETKAPALPLTWR